jgi:hypothetical protein
MFNPFHREWSLLQNWFLVSRELLLLWDRHTSPPQEKNVPERISLSSSNGLTIFLVSGFTKTPRPMAPAWYGMSAEALMGKELNTQMERLLPPARVQPCHQVGNLLLGVQMKTKRTSPILPERKNRLRTTALPA